jgi:hypothetical protein
VITCDYEGYDDGLSLWLQFRDDDGHLDRAIDLLLDLKGCLLPFRISRDKRR